MWTKLWREVAATHVFVGPPAVESTTEAELAALPFAARKYMDFFRVAPGTAKRWSFCISWMGRFRMAPNRAWMPFRSVQYDLRRPVARIFHMKLRMKQIFPIIASDSYVNGHGHMLGKLAGIVTVADGRGSEFDEGELVTWLNDVVLFAPSMLLGSSTRWSHVDNQNFELAFTDRGCSVNARVTIDDQGAPINFETTNRYVNDAFDPKRPLVRGRWSTPIESWYRSGDQPFPMRGKAIWHLDRADFTYADFELVPSSVALDVAPSERSAHTGAAA